MIAVSHLTALTTPPETFIDAAAGAGFGGVGLRLAPPAHAPDYWPLLGDMNRIRALRRRAEDQGIRVFEAESFGIGPDYRPDSALPALEAAAEIGAAHVVAGGFDTDRNRLIAHYEALACNAAEFGLGVVIEFISFRALRDLGDALMVIEQVGRANLRMLVDTIHLARTGGTPAQVAKLPPALLGYVHLCDAARALPTGMDLAQEVREARMFPGEGGLPLRELVDLLPATMDYSLEAPVAQWAGLPVEERLRIAARKTHALLAARSHGAVQGARTAEGASCAAS